MMRILMWNPVTEKYEPQARREAEEFLPPFALECLEIAFGEIEDFEPRPADCQCSDYTFETYGCMCRIRIQPGSP